MAECKVLVTAFDVGDEGVLCTLSVSREPPHCCIFLRRFCGACKG
jgi:hypothetical protein